MARRRKSRGSRRRKTYYCRRCGRRHRKNSRIGRAHRR